VNPHPDLELKLTGLHKRQKNSISIAKLQIKRSHINNEGQQWIILIVDIRTIFLTATSASFSIVVLLQCSFNSSLFLSYDSIYFVVHSDLELRFFVPYFLHIWTDLKFLSKITLPINFIILLAHFLNIKHNLSYLLSVYHTFFFNLAHFHTYWHISSYFPICSTLLLLKICFSSVLQKKIKKPNFIFIVCAILAKEHIQTKQTS